jgi:hypothetical protein
LRLGSVEESVARVCKRVEAGGHGIPENAIRRRFGKSAGYFETIYKPLVDSWYLWDSREGGFVVIARRAVKGKLDVPKMEAALKRAAYKALHGTREERSGRFASRTEARQPARAKLPASNGRETGKPKG